MFNLLLTPNTASTCLFFGVWRYQHFEPCLVFFLSLVPTLIIQYNMLLFLKNKTIYQFLFTPKRHSYDDKAKCCGLT